MGTIDGYTALCIQSEDSNLSTTIEDSSFNEKTFTVSTATPSYNQSIADGGIFHSTDLAKFGSSSLRLGGEEYLTTGYSTDFNLCGGDDFTIDFWMYSPPQDENVILAQSATSGTYYPAWAIWQFYSGGLTFNLWPGSGSANITLSYSPGTAALNNKWNHFAIVRHGDVTTLYFNGVYLNGVTGVSQTQAITGVPGAALDFSFGANQKPPVCNIEEFRISNGIARWTEDFTPPTEAYVGDPTVEGVLETQQAIVVSEATSEVYIEPITGDGSLETQPAVVVGGAYTGHTVICVQSETTDLSTIVVDSSPFNKTLTIKTDPYISTWADGGIYHSTDTSKFGSSSLRSGGEEYLETTDLSTDFGLWGWDFTIDFWIRVDSAMPVIPNGSRSDWIAYSFGGEYNLDGSKDLDSGYWSLRMYQGALNFTLEPGIGVTPKIYVSSDGVVPTDRWKHVAIVSDKTDFTVTFYLDGVAKSSFTSEEAAFSWPQNRESTLSLLGMEGLYSFVGNIEEFRISKGEALWTEDFIPPIGPYSRSDIVYGSLITQQAEVISSAYTAAFVYAALETQEVIINSIASLSIRSGVLVTAPAEVTGLIIESVAPRLAMGELETKIPKILGAVSTQIFASGELETRIPKVIGAVLQNSGILETELPIIDSVVVIRNKAYGVLVTKNSIIDATAEITNIAQGECITDFAEVFGSILNDGISISGNLTTKLPVLLGTTKLTTFADGDLITEIPDIKAAIIVTDGYEVISYDRYRQCNL